MPSLNFQERFVPLIESGQKCQTIRLVGKRPIKPGDPLFLFTGLRTKKCRRLFPPFPYFMYGKKYVTIPGTGELKLEDVPFVICKSVEPIRISDITVGNKLNNMYQCYEEMLKIANDDGFNHLKVFKQFFQNQYGLPFEGVLIKW